MTYHADTAIESQDNMLSMSASEGQTPSLHHTLRRAAKRKRKENAGAMEEREKGEEMVTERMQEVIRRKGNCFLYKHPCAKVQDQPAAV